MTRRSTGSRREERTKRGGGPMHGWAWRKVINRLKPMDILEAEQLEAIHLASLQLLAEEGMEVLEPNAIEICAKAGAIVDRGTKMVRFDPALIMELVGKAPKSFTVHARNPERSLDYGGKSMVFGTVAGPPFVNDLDRGRRNGNYETLCELIRLQHQIPVIHSNGAGMVEAVDLPVDSRHLDVAYANLTLTDKLWLARGIGEQRIRDSVSLLAIAHGTTVEALKEKPVLLSVISVNSPRRVDPEMIGGLTALVDSGQVTIVTPFTLLGAMTPVTLAGGLVQQNAEALFGIAYTQILKPGAPVIYGGFTSNVDMKSGAPAFGTPENVVATIAGGQLARKYGLPFRASNCNAANAVDAQATYESLNMLWACVLGGVNFVHHAAGWMEGGLTVSYEKMILDAELLQNMVEIMKPLEVSPATIALDAMREVGPGGHFFGAAHTLERYETAFYNPILSDWRPFKSWEEAGAETATQRANKVWKQLLADYEKPPIDPGVDEALKDFIARRKREMHGRAAA